MIWWLWWLTLATDFNLRLAKPQDALDRRKRPGEEETRSFVRRERGHSGLVLQPTQFLDEQGSSALATKLAHMSRLARVQKVTQDRTNASLLQQKGDRSEPVSKQSVCESDAVAPYMTSIDKDLKACMDKKFRALGDYDPSIATDAVQEIIVECYDKMFTRIMPTGDQCKALRNMLKCEEMEGRVENADIAIDIEKRRLRVCPHDKTCFPGEASVLLPGSVQKKMRELATGDRVLVQQAGGQLAYEPVLGFLHIARGGPITSHAYLRVVHQLGELHISANHMLFVEDRTSASLRRDKLAMELQIGDTLFVAQSEGMELLRSKILAISADTSDLGMYAPFTPSGTLLVDGTLVSTYANTLELRASHALIHSILFPVRWLHRLALGVSVRRFQSLPPDAEYLHPYVAMLQRVLHLS